VHILLLSQYYPPETGAPQNRLSGLARELKRLGHQVEVLTAMPNYPAMEIHPAYRGIRFMKETVDGITVNRSWIYVSKNRSVFSRLLNYFSFTFSAMIAARQLPGRFDVVLCESPPLFLGISGWWIAKRKKAQFVFNVSDLWPESAEKLGVIRNRFFLNAATKLEEWLYRKSTLVTGQTQGICADIQKRFPGKKVHWLPNGVDRSLMNEPPAGNWRSSSGYSDSDFLVLYAGIIGLAQGLDTVLDAAKALPNDSRVRFLLLGEGPEKERLIERKRSEKIDRVDFPNAVKRETMPEVIHAVDAAVVPLKKMDLFLGAIPSKIFESLALGKPILLGVDGEARTLFIDQGQCGLYVEPENALALAKSAQQLSEEPELVKTLGGNGRKTVESRFMRENITRALCAVLEDSLKNDDNNAGH
jgi:glycosyltransferase involved in cell wall biosynthesis